MSRGFALLPWLLAVCIAVVACTDDEPGSVTSDAGDGGGTANPGAPRPDAGGVADEDAGSVADEDGGACAEASSGTLDVQFTIPDGAMPEVLLLTGPADYSHALREAEEFELPGGQYSLEAFRLTTDEGLVGRAYFPDPAKASACVSEDVPAKLATQFELEPGSQKLWFSNGNAMFHTGAFAAADLEASGDPSAAVEISENLTAGGALAFDREGNLWVADSDRVLGYLRGTLGRSRSSAPDVVIKGDAVCEPDIVPCGPSALAFDSTGNLWLALRTQVTRIDAADLAESGSPAAAVTLSGAAIDAPEALAFDKDGDLWIAIAVDSKVIEIEASRLVADDSAAPDRTFTGMTMPPVLIGLGDPTTLAFDADGNLWVGYFGPNVLARYTPAELAMGGVITPEVQLELGVLALIEGMAFDNAGNLWVSGSQGTLVGISAAQLKPDGVPETDAIVIDSADIGYVSGIALDPPGAGTPIAR